MEIDLVDDDSVILVTGEEHRLQGNEYYKKLNYKEALECYTAAIDTEPNVALFYSNRSAANLMLLRFQDALEDAKKACNLDGTNIKALVRLSKCHLLLGNCDASRTVIGRIKQLEPTNNDLIAQSSDLIVFEDSFRQYQSQNDKNDFRHALHCIDNCIKIAHASLEMKLIRVELLINLKRYSEAKDILEKQIIDNKDADNQVTSEALLFRGVCFYYMGHLDKANNHLLHVLRLNPDHKKAQLVFKRCKKLSQLKEDGNTFVRGCQYEKARATYTEALSVDTVHDSMNAILYFNRALTLLKLQRWQEALNDCDEALRLDPSYEKVRSRRVQCIMGLELWQEAVKEATRLQKEAPSDEHARMLKEAQVGLKRSKEMDLYKVLGVARSANDAELKKGYRQRALVHHPDRHSHADANTRKEEEQKFKEVNTAYSVLSDPKKKQMYDSGVDLDTVLGNGGGSGQGGHNGGDPYEVFQTFFNNGGQQKCRFQFQ